LLSVVTLAVATRWLGLSWVALLRRTVLLWPFIGLTAAGLLGQPDWALRVGNLILKAVLSVWILTLLTQTTTVIELTAGLRRLHFPAIWVAVFAFLIRYAAVLSHEWKQMRLAREARTFRLGRSERFKLLAQSLGFLFIRAYERAERIHQAMLARGYHSP
jgi:cobalt/nickel transport system permease protein